MTFVLAVISDENVEEPEYVVGVSIGQVAEAVLEYLRSTQPVTPTGERLEVPTELGFHSAYRWIVEHDDLFPDITIDWASTEPAYGVEPMYVPVVFKMRCADNRKSLFTAHTPVGER